MIGTLVIVVIAFACSDDDSDVTGPGGFEADIDDFTGYKSWETVDYVTGPVNPILSTAHMGGDIAFSRLIYKKFNC